jgi:hypothetical protein
VVHAAFGVEVLILLFAGDDFFKAVVVFEGAFENRACQQIAKLDAHNGARHGGLMILKPHDLIR